jgi:hypothetical protein
MTEDNEHAKTLMAARDKLVTKRRELAERRLNDAIDPKATSAAQIVAVQRAL